MGKDISDRRDVVWGSDWAGRRSSEVYARLEKFNRRNEGFGVEIVEVTEQWSNFWGKTALLYVNMGDSYIKTLCYSPITNKFYHSDWGTLVEEKLPRYIRDRII